MMPRKKKIDLVEDKQPVAKKTAVKKTAVKKTAVKKTVAKKTVSKHIPAKKVVKKTAAKTTKKNQVVDDHGWEAEFDEAFQTIISKSSNNHSSGNTVLDLNFDLNPDSYSYSPSTKGHHKLFGWIRKIFR